MKVPRWLASLACGGMLFAQLVAANAQEAATEAGEGSHATAVATSPSVKTPPANVTGCWSGSTDDDAFGIGDAFFQFTQNTNGKGILRKASGFDFEWDGGSTFAFAPVAGNIKGLALKFHGNASHCPVAFNGVVNQAGDEITGTYSFGGQCRKEGFAQGTFDVTPTNC